MNLLLELKLSNDCKRTGGRYFHVSKNSRENRKSAERGAHEEMFEIVLMCPLTKSFIVKLIKLQTAFVASIL